VAGRSKAQVKAPEQVEKTSFSSSTRGLVQRKCSDCEKKKLLSPNHGFDQVMQKKLAVSRPGDVYEQEADSVAQKIVSMQGPMTAINLHSAPVNALHRQQEDLKKPPDPITAQDDRIGNEPRMKDRLKEREDLVKLIIDALKGATLTPDAQKEKDKEKIEEILSNAAKAVAKTEKGKEIIDWLAERSWVDLKETFKKSTLTGSTAIALLVSIGGGVLFGAYTKGDKLPLKSLDVPIVAGLELNLEFKGPVNKPENWSVGFTYTPGTKDEEPEQSATSRKILKDRAREEKINKVFPSFPSEKQEEKRAREISRLEYQQFLKSHKGNVSIHDLARSSPLFGLPSSASPFNYRPRDREEEIPIQRKETGGGRLDSVQPIVHEVLGSPGQPLDQETRAFFEPRFGYDFSHVRVHTDSKAAESARAMNALAYTIERDIFFGQGEYSPRTKQGQELLAHEITHALQQSSSNGLHLAPFEIVNHINDAESEEDSFSESIIDKRISSKVSRITPRIQRRSGSEMFQKGQIVTLKLTVLRMANGPGSNVIAAILKKGDSLELGNLYRYGGGKVFYATVIKNSDERYNGKTGVVRTEWVQPAEEKIASPTETKLGLPEANPSKSRDEMMEDFPLVAVTPYDPSGIKAFQVTMRNYIDNRYEALGVAADYSGYVLYCSGIDLPIYLPSSYVNLSLNEACLPSGMQYANREEALGALGKDAATSYAYYQAAGGLIAPTVFSPATTPRIAQDIIEWFKHLRDAATETFEYALTMTGIYIFAKIIPPVSSFFKSKLGRSQAAKQKAFETEAKAAQRESIERGIRNIISRQLAKDLVTKLRNEGKPVIANLCGAGEVKDAININNMAFPRKNIPNLIVNDAEEIGSIFNPGDVDGFVGNRMPARALNWQKIANGCNKVLRTGGTVDFNIYYYNDIEKTIIKALEDASFREVQNVARPYFDAKKVEFINVPSNFRFKGKK
jgi:hypothetical protein